MISLLAFTVYSTYNKWIISNQQKIIVYNVPKYQAVDFISGSNYQFVGDSILLEDGLLQNFHLKPARIAFQLNSRIDTLPNYFNRNIFHQYNNKKIVIINEPLFIEPAETRTDIDLIIISKNPKLSIAQLLQIFNCKQIVFDASNAYWQIEKWQKECNDLNVNFFSIPARGAFIYNIGI